MLHLALKLKAMEPELQLLRKIAPKIEARLKQWEVDQKGKV